MLFCTFLYRPCTATTWKCLIASFMEDVNKRRRISFSLSKLECGPQEINSREIRLHLPFSANWNKRDKDWTKREFIVKLTFSLPLPSLMLKLPNNDAKPPPKWILLKFDVFRIRPRLGGLPHLETFTWQNLTPAERVTRSGRPGYPPRRITPPIM